MYIELKDGSCFDIYEDKATPTAVVLMPLGKQQEVNNAYKAFSKEKNLSEFYFKTSTGTAAKFENYIFDKMSVEGTEGAYTVTMHTHQMSEVEVLKAQIDKQREEFNTFRATASVTIYNLLDAQEAQNEVLDYILMGEPESKPKETDSMNEMDMVLDIIGEPESEEMVESSETVKPESEEMVESSETVKPEQEEEVTTDGEVSGDENQTGEA